MDCIKIKDVSFSRLGQADIDHIQFIIDNHSFLSGGIGLGYLATLLFKSKPAQASYNLSQANFGLMANAMSSIPKISRKIIRDKIKYHMNYAYELCIWKRARILERFI